MGVGLIALLVFLSITIVWTAVLKRHIGEAMLISLIATALFGGSNFFVLIYDGLVYAFTNDIIFAAMAFVFVSIVIQKADITRKLIDILNSMLGRLPGSAGYIATIAAALFGMVSPSGSANQAVVGSITIPWMIRTGFKKETAATISTGNSGFGFVFPASIGMMILLGFEPIAKAVTQGQFVRAIMVGGLYCLIYRLLLILFFVKRENIKAVPESEIRPLKETFKAGWKSLLIFLGIVIPVLLTLGPIAERLKSNVLIGDVAIKSISLMVWVPTLILVISLIVGRGKLPKSFKGMYGFVREIAPMFSELSVVIIFAFAVSDVLGKLGLTEDLTAFISQFDLPGWLMVLLIGLLVSIVAGPLSGSATATMVGLFAFTAFTAVGVTPLAACVAICMFLSTEGSSPPSSAQIYVAAGMAGTNPSKSFIPLIIYYVVIPTVIGCLLAMGILPIPY